MFVNKSWNGVQRNDGRIGCPSLRRSTASIPAFILPDLIYPENLRTPVERGMTIPLSYVCDSLGYNGDFFYSFVSFPLKLMPEIQPFTGYRYNLAKVGALSDVVAPPYDVIDDPLNEELLAKSPYNTVRLILDKMFPDDDAENNRYTRTAKRLKEWKESGVLQKEKNAAIYVYH